MKSPRIFTVASALAAICLATSPSAAEPAPTLEPTLALPFRDNGVLHTSL